MGADSNAGAALAGGSSSHDGRSQRDENNRLRVGKRGGSKSLRHSTPRTSAVSSRRSSGPDMAVQRERLARLEKEAESKPASEAAAKTEPALKYRVKFVNHLGEATLCDISQEDTFAEIVPSIAEKLRMPPKASYLLIYKDTDDEEIGVGCTGNLQEMLALFEPGSRIQLRIVPYHIINHSALDTISSLWGYSSTPNIFMSEPELAPSGGKDDGGNASDKGSDD
ncbi:hypothetical protein H4R21_004736, partial [Coemansia helicoidea]